MMTLGAKTWLPMSALVTGALLLAMPAGAGEKTIGKPIERNGMAIAAVYLQPVRMQPAMPLAKRPDIHLEADISAIKGNKHGFSEGAWIPYLTISYKIEKLGGGFKALGSFMPMVANDGTHYGANVKLAGPGKYRVTYRIHPPIMAGLFRHTDKETGTAKWWAPFTTSWTFAYVGVGKKGTY